MADLRRAFTVSGLDVAIRPQDCLNCCDAPQALALIGAGRASYVFTAVALPEDTEDLIATIGCYLEAKDGWITNALACGRLRHCLHARIARL